MALAVDGFHVMRAMADNAALFEDVRADANKQATALFSKQVKKADLQKLRDIHRAIGAEDFRKMVDVLKGIGTLLRKVDKYNPDLKGMPENNQRTLLIALARVEAQPHEKPVKPNPPKVPKAEKNVKSEPRKESKAESANNRSKEVKEKKKEPGIMDLESMRVRKR
jgi:hypothetical protein